MQIYIIIQEKKIQKLEIEDARNILILNEEKLAKSKR